MNIPSVPTDNLYKFLSIFGLIIFLAAIYLSDVLEEKIHNTSGRLVYLDGTISTDSIKHSFALERIRKKMEYHKENNLVGEHQDYSDLDLTFENYEIESNKYLGLIIEKSEIYRDLVFYLRRQRIYSIYAIVLMTSGVFCMIFGFKLWYFKHQVYIDAETKWKGETFIELLKDAEELSKNNIEKMEINEDKIPDKP